jgi:hypothetical protein
VVKVKVKAENGAKTRKESKSCEVKIITQEHRVRVENTVSKVMSAARCS